MRSCRTVRFLFKVSPLNSWRRALIERHLLGCPDCSRAVASREEAGRVFAWASRAEGMSDPWPDFARRLARDGHELRHHPGRAGSWAAAAGLTAAAVALALILIPGPRLPEPDIKLRLESLELNGAPGRAIIFQGRDPNTTFVWVEN